MTTTTVLPDRLAALDDYEQMRQSAQSSPKAMDFWIRVDATQDACWPWMGRHDDRGYGRVGFQGRVNVGAHRVAWALSHDGTLPEEWVLHSCDNPPCVRPTHLFLGDATDNNRDRQSKGRTRGWAGRSGTDHHRFVVTDEVAQQMRALRARACTQQSIADRFGVSRGYVAQIVSGVLPLNTRGRA